MNPCDSLKSDFNEVSIKFNGEVIAKGVGPSQSLELLDGLVNEIRRKERNGDHKRQ